MLTILFNNQDYYEGMYNKFQKSFKIDDVDRLEVYGDLKQKVMVNAYIFERGNVKAAGHISMPYPAVSGLEKAIEKAANDKSKDVIITVNCIMSNWTIDMEWIEPEKDNDPITKTKDNPAMIAA